MNPYQKLCFAVAVVFMVGVLLQVGARAQGPAELSAGNSSTSADVPDPKPTPPPDPPPTPADADSNWRVAISFYGWFPGTHGTVGVLGHNAGVHESFADVFHYLKGVIPIAVDTRKGRFVMPLDFFWVKLGDNKAIPLTDLDQHSINLHVTESIFTPKIGYRILDGEHLKIDALAGVRYWYVSENITLLPSGLGNTQSANWVDGLGGARFTVPLSNKAAIIVGGDAGGGGANLDYQAVGLLTYKFTPKLGLGLGWRYLDVDYRGNRQFIYDVAQTGALAGLFYEFGGKPPVPASASCSVSPRQVQAGEPVTATVSTQNFNPKHSVDYKWSSNGPHVSGSGANATVDTAGVRPGTYTVSVTASDPKQKKNNSAICQSTFAVLEPPRRPPVASCSAIPNAVKAGDPATISVSANSPDSSPLSYAYSSTAGNISGSGTSAALDTTSAQPGSSITATATVTDGRGLTATCTAIVNVLSPPMTVQEVREVGECKFMNPKKPSRVDNECKAVLDDVALRLQREPNGKLVVVGYAAEEEKVTYQQLGAQRSVNVKYYLTSGEGNQKIDPAMIEPRVGTKADKSAKFYFVPSGPNFTAEETVKVDESALQAQARNAPVPKKKTKKVSTTPVQ